MSPARKADKRGRSKGSLGSFVAVERYLLNSKAWLHLKPMARACYVEMAMAYNGSNNGRIAYATRVMAERLGVDKATASRAIAELERHGFLFVTQRSAYHIKRSAEFRLTAFKCDRSGEWASKLFMQWASEIQNTDAWVQLCGCTSATVKQKRPPKQALQLHQCNSFEDKDASHSCTSAPLLYSSHKQRAPLSPAKAGAANYRASVPTSPLNSQTPIATNNPAHGPDSFTTVTGQPLRSLAEIELSIPVAFEAELPWCRVSESNPLNAALARLGGSIKRAGQSPPTIHKAA